MKPRLLLTFLAVFAPWSAAHAGRGKEFTEADRAWWSFQPVREVAVPQVGNASWVRTPVDRFILAKLEAAGLQPAAVASRDVLARRVYFEVLGLPPTREQVGEFVNDSTPEAWENLVDRLLNSPHYGERQARLWLDLVRYADSDGYKSDDYRPDAWRYRDYVISSFNDDKPYNRFLSEQLAGDELYPGDMQALVATGYLRHWIYEYNNRDAAGQWNTILNDITDTTADVFMGLGLQCARCHDHKFDPLLQSDYYRLQAFFAALDPRDSTGLLPAGEQTNRQLQLEKWETATSEVRRKIAEIQTPELEKAKEKAIAAFPPETQLLLGKPAGQRTSKEQQVANLAWRQVLYEWERVDARIKGDAKGQLVALRKELAAFDELKPSPLPTAATAADLGPQAPEVIIPRREATGNVLPGFPALLEPDPAVVTPYPHSTGRRSALAAWLARPENPLTARVMVNRLWQQHFGKGLSATTSDFGTLGDPPSHPELLDWLARQFVRENWSVKKIHRLILTSAAWRQSHVSPVAEKAKLADPENRLLWQWQTRRLEAEQIRDAIFQATGELDRTAGGPGVDHSKPRRAIYTKVLRNTRDPLTDVFDAPQNFQSTPVRDSTTTATQSLYLANSVFMAERAAAMAGELSALSEQPAAQVEAAWWRTAGRLPTTEEREESLAFLDSAAAVVPIVALTGLTSHLMPQRNGKAVALAPGSALEHLVTDALSLPAEGFSCETVALLHSIYATGSIRTLAGQWMAGASSSGWSFGVTGQKSRQKPQMPVFLISGPDENGVVVNEAVFSDITLQLDRSYYLGASFQPAAGGKPGSVTFYVQDLSNEDEGLQTSNVPHPVTRLTANPSPVFIGAAGNAPESLWDGLIDEMRLSRGFITPRSTILVQPAPGPDTLACWQFEPGRNLREEVGGRRNLHPPKGPGAAGSGLHALTDLCHTLLSSSAMLYVE